MLLVVCYSQLFRKISPANEAPTNTGTYPSIRFLLLRRQCSCHEPWILIPSSKSAWSKTSDRMKKWCQPELCPHIWELLSTSMIDAVIDMQLPAAPGEATERQSRLIKRLFLDHLHVGGKKRLSFKEGAERMYLLKFLPAAISHARSGRPTSRCFNLIPSVAFKDTWLQTLLRYWSQEKVMRMTNPKCRWSGGRHSTPRTSPLDTQ